MILSIDFNFTPSDKRDPQSQNDCEIIEMWLCEEGDGEDNKVPDRIQNDLALNRHLLAALYRIHQIIPK